MRDSGTLEVWGGAHRQQGPTGHDIRGRVPSGAAYPTRDHEEVCLVVTLAATHTVVGVFGVLAALAGVEHGVGEIAEGPVRPEGMVIRSWPEHPAFDVLDGEPAMTLVPDLLVSGVVTVLVSVALAAGAAGLRPSSGPPAATTRRLAGVWPWAVVVGSAGFLGLVPGVLIAHSLWGTPPATAVYGLSAMAFGGLVVALASARARDRVRLGLQGG